MTLLGKLGGDQAGAAIAEFALIAPVVLLTLFGLFDMAHGMYTKSMLQGAIEQAARNSTIEGATTGPLDAVVTSAVRRVSPNATVTFNRQSYTSFSDVGQAEDFIDGNTDGVCSSGETFEDANANGVWDAEQGRSGNGSARDAVLYTVSVSYPRLFPIAKFIGGSNAMQMNSMTILRNQPFSMQGAPATGICP